MIDMAPMFAFSVQDVAQLLLFAFGYGVLYAKVGALKDAFASFKEDSEKQQVKTDARHERLETRFVETMDALAGALNNLGMEVRTGLAEHGARIKHMEDTIRTQRQRPSNDE